MASVTITKHDIGSVSSGQLNHLYRTHDNYSNADIDISKSGQNIPLGGCQSADDARRRLQERIAAVDAVLPPKRRAKNRVVAVEYCVPAPREDMTEDEQIRYLKQAYHALERKFGKDNIICGVIHVDERHTYTDVDGQHTSRVHLHIIGVPFVPSKGINGKQFLQRKTYNEVNQVMDDVCQQMYGYAYRDGTKQKSRGSVEQLKQAGENAREYEITQKAATDVDIAIMRQQADKEIADKKAAAELSQERQSMVAQAKIDAMYSDAEQEILEYKLEQSKLIDRDMDDLRAERLNKLEREHERAKRAKMGEIQALEVKRSDLSMSVDELANKLERLNDEWQSAEREVSDYRKAKITDANQEAQSIVADSFGRRDKLLNEVMELNQEVESLQAQIDDLRQESGLLSVVNWVVENGYLDRVQDLYEHEHDEREYDGR
jgi:hypothetical protein